MNVEHSRTEDIHLRHRSLTYLCDGSVVHDDDEVGVSEEAGVVSTEEACLVFEESHHAVVEQMLSYVGVDRCQRVVQQVHVLVLSSKQTNLTHSSCNNLSNMAFSR